MRFLFLQQRFLLWATIAWTLFATGVQDLDAWTPIIHGHNHYQSLPRGIHANRLQQSVTTTSTFTFFPFYHPRRQSSPLSSRKIILKPATRLAAFGRPNDDEKKKKEGYKFGDLTRALGRRVTGNNNYQFGDISRKLDTQAKTRVTQLTGQKEYKFGDLSRWADFQVKEKTANYTGKENYQVGDISKEVIRRILAGEYDLEDVVLALRVVLQMGASLTPIARLLPVTVSLEILNVGLAQDVGSKVLGGVAKTLDERFKSAITGDAKYQLGDLTKKQLADALTKFTGKDSYSFGDVSQAVAARLAEMDTDSNSNGSSSGSSKATAATGKALLEELSNNDALAEWDRKFLEESSDRKGQAPPKTR